MSQTTTPSSATMSMDQLAQAVRNASPHGRDLAISRFSNAMMAVLQRRLSHTLRFGDQQDLPHDPASYRELWCSAANWGTHVALKKVLRGDEVDSILAFAYTAAWRSAVDQLRKLSLRRPVNVRVGDEELNATPTRDGHEIPLTHLEVHSLAQRFAKTILSELHLGQAAERHAYAAMLQNVLMDEAHPPIDTIARGLTAAVQASHPRGVDPATKEMLALALSVLKQPTAEIARTLKLQEKSIACYVKRGRTRLRRMVGMAPAKPRCKSTKPPRAPDGKQDIARARRTSNHHHGLLTSSV